MSIGNKRIKGVIFDLDGTLINSIEDIHDSLNIVLELHHHPTIKLKTCSDLVGNGLRNLLNEALPDEFRKDSYTSRLLSELKKEYAKRLLNKTCIYEGIDKMLDDLSIKGYILCVLSNKLQKSTQSLVNSLLGKWRFAVVAGATENRPLKPHPESVRYILNETGLTVDEMIIVGDGETDVIAAKNTGMKMIAISWGYRNKKDLYSLKPDFMIDHPGELAKIL
ncbi:MAG: HAD family hydrolase [Bacteroidetes bacterium]|nr:HAD family hydrolase [Bacteroidota bacterium]